MSPIIHVLRVCALLTALAPAAVFLSAQADAPIPESVAPVKEYPTETLEAGQAAFGRNCAFCHGRDTGGGESGPDLTRSLLVAGDVDGDKMGPVIRNGQGEMPSFSVGAEEVAALVAFIHNQKRIAESQVGGRRGVETADLKTGDVTQGKAFFEGKGTCSTCHSVTGDLAGVASKYEGLALMRRMLYPRGADVSVIVTLPSGETVSGKREYLDEFAIGLREDDGTYRSFALDAVQVATDAPAEAHVALLPVYSDDDLHNVMTYLLTLE
jgi:cytochrome c oxidase cbb3-type subunit 3